MLRYRTGYYHVVSGSATSAREEGMLARTGSLCIAAKRYWRSSVLAAAALTLLPLGSAAWGQAADPNAPALRLINTIPINGTAGNRATKMYSFDISWVDQVTGLFYLADRSNAAVDVIDTTGAFTGKPDSMYGQTGRNPAFTPGFAGDTGNTATSGPNGVVSASPSSSQAACLFATDSPSRVVSFNTSVSFTAAVTALSTGGQARADELAYDPA